MPVAGVSPVLVLACAMTWALSSWLQNQGCLAARPPTEARGPACTGLQARACSSAHRPCVGASLPWAGGERDLGSDSAKQA